MEKNTVTIDLERYNELVKAENKIETLVAIVESDDFKYDSYSKETSKCIDVVLGIERGDNR